MAIMIVRPEGLLPTRIARRELHTAEELVEIPDEERAARRQAAEAAEADGRRVDGAAGRQSRLGRRTRAPRRPPRRPQDAPMTPS